MSLNIKNMRHIGENLMKLDFATDKNVVILVGDNGLGKTTVLDAIASTLATYCTQFPGIPDFQLKDWDVHINRNGQISPYSKSEAVLSDNLQDLTLIKYVRCSETASHKSFGSLKVYAKECKKAILSGNGDVVLPVFAYYGSERKSLKSPKGYQELHRTYERWECYKGALDPQSDISHLLQWLDSAQRQEQITRRRLRDVSYKSPSLEVVRNALSKVVPKYENPRIELNPFRFVMAYIESEGVQREVRLEQMDDGSKMVISMVLDLASRMSIANPNLSNPLQAPGIVLIDDIELHLHPRWQRDILSQLTHVFENVQFIVTTHSPVIVMGAASFAQIINLNTQPHTRIDLTISSISSVLLSELFGLKSLFCPIWDDKMKERDHILSQKELSTDNEVRLAELDEELKGLTVLQDSNAIHSQKILEEIASQLNLINSES